MLKALPKNVWILATCQSLMISCSSLVVFAGSIIGVALAPSEELSTLPIGAMVIGTALFALPVTLLTNRFGRKNIFITVSTLSMGIFILIAFSLRLEAFYLFCSSLLLLGLPIATIQQFRFAAMESVDVELRPKAASVVLFGGIIAVFIGTEVALLGKDLFRVEYVGSFLMLAFIYFFATILLFKFQNPIVEKAEEKQSGRSLLEIAKQPVFWIAVLSAVLGFAIMTFIMTATPISMHAISGYSLEDTKRVIQSHVVAMFLPSLFAGWLISKYGYARIIIAGLVMYVLSIIAAVSGFEFVNYWVALVLLGIGWNFLFISGTTLLPSSYEENERYKVQAVNDFLIFSGRAAVALSAGWFVYKWGWVDMLLGTIPFILIIFGAVVAWSIKDIQVLLTRFFKSE